MSYGSALDPIVWKVYFDDILQLVPQAKAQDDDCTLHVAITKQFIFLTRLRTLYLPVEQVRQDTTAPDKTQTVLISQSFHPGVINTRHQGNRVLGIQINRDMAFTCHVSTNEDLQPLQHRRDVAALRVMCKVQGQLATALPSLRLPWRLHLRSLYIELQFLPR